MKTSLTVLLVMQLYGLTLCVIKKHFFIDMKKPQEEAKLYCKTYFHSLSTFTNDIEELQFLEDAFVQTSDAWVGLGKETGITEWKWLGNEVATRINWDKDKPDLKADNNNCVFIHKDHKKLNDKPCTESRTFFCMRIFEIVLVEQIETWETSLEYCRDHYDDLATLSSNRSMEYSLSKMTEAQTEYVWIGLRFLAGEWFWVGGDDLDYEVWSEAGQPQCPARNLRCGALDRKTNIWTPRDCEEKLKFLCSANPDIL